MILHEQETGLLKLFRDLQNPEYSSVTDLRAPLAKGCDHEIMRAFKTHPKNVSWSIEIEFCVVMGLQL
jgi:hypothetical protein